MLSAIGVIIGFITFAISLPPGLIISISAWRSLKKKNVPVKRIGLFFLVSLILSVLFWIFLTGALVDLESSGGAPTEEDWINLYKFFALMGALPGGSLTITGLALRISNRSSRKKIV